MTIETNSSKVGHISLLNLQGKTSDDLTDLILNCTEFVFQETLEIMFLTEQQSLEYFKTLVKSMESPPPPPRLLDSQTEESGKMLSNKYMD